MEKDTQERLVKKKLLVKLSDEEMRSLGAQAGELNTQINRLKLEFDDLKESYKNKISGMTGELNYMLKTLQAGQDYKEMECIEVKDYAEKKVRYILGEDVLFERPFTEADLQVSIFS